ncbi:hypothetical protein GDO81_011518 [Engystomops pustulosus]|uniref:DNA endonuclease RBBP8 n=1 Tax=Engystomops pustulosus TaxID=76066 RepID=A0AAV7BEP5_ENGPU|nr:hypothetical protein GDO81_011518 [Engystomops pustulosus]KAG8571076.1 hypothetical protein GDO81_011518 [Engystomops pustulosus]KAG8571077.1 hypothetical protein GDO81_011518 [Engystomops pustulosus]KAG8571078.1 hypothetical protein GDO81_011518 [Engystomops pustulosus]
MLEQVIGTVCVKMNISGSSCGSPSSTESLTPGDLFKELWTKLKDCHDKELQELLMKINKLKTQRCLDAQRLEEFYTKNQQLREQQKALHDTIKVLEDRLRAGLCDRCAVTEEHMRKKQQEFENIRQQNLKLITELMDEKNALQEENKRLLKQLEQMQKAAESEKKRHEEVVGADDGVIPDSPVCSFPINVVSRMRRKKINKHVRYTEHLQDDSSASQCANNTGQRIFTSTQVNTGKEEAILVADTCALQLSPLPTKQEMADLTPEKPVFNLAAVVAETIGLDANLEESQSQSVLNNLRTDAGAVQVLNKHEEHSPSELEFTENTQSNPHDVEWDTQRVSPVFGMAAPKIETTTNTDNGSSLLPIGISLKSSYSNKSSVHVLTKAEDASLVSEYRAETSSVISQCSGNNQQSLRRSPSDSVISGLTTTDAFMSKDHVTRDAYKQTASRCVKRKKVESEGDTNCETASVNKENDFPLKNVNGISLDKPLDLSDRFSGLCPQEKGREYPRSKMKQTSIQETFKLGTKSSSMGCSSPGSYFQSREGSLQTLNHKKTRKGDCSASWIQDDGEGVEEDSQLFGNKEETGVHVPKRPNRSIDRGYKPASVLQPNPHLLQTRDTEKDLASVENVQWSIDPGADLSQYKMDNTVVDDKDENHINPEFEDLDYTYVSDSMLLKMKNLKNADDSLHEETEHDSFVEMFDKTECDEYVSYAQDPSSTQRMDCREEHCDGPAIHNKGLVNGKGKSDKEEAYYKQKAYVEPYVQDVEMKKPVVDFPHIEVVRNKEERRKLQGHTCKECELYYADLPEEERAKKLSACSRHRFRYIPPSTPENFWEVGFPSTQTCKERGYIKEQMSPCQRPRRRQPYNAMFSTKGKEQKI